MRLALAFLTVLLLSGCGGSGGNSTDSSSEAIQRAEALSTVRSLRVSQALITLTRAAFSGATSTGRVEYGEGLYYNSTASLSGATVRLYRDEARTDAAGTIVFTRTSDGLGYPQTLDAVVDIESESHPVTGTYTVTLLDEDSTRMQGQVLAVAPGQTLNINFNLLAESNSVTGSIRASDGQRTVALNNLVGTIDPSNGTLTARSQLTITPPNVSTSVDIVIRKDNSGEVELGDGVAAEWDAAGHGTIILVGNRRLDTRF